MKVLKNNRFKKGDRDKYVGIYDHIEGTVLDVGGKKVRVQFDEFTEHGTDVIEVNDPKLVNLTAEEEEKEKEKDRLLKNFFPQYFE